MIDAPKRPAIYADLEAAPEQLVAEIVGGELVTRHHGYAAPAMVRTMLGYALRDIAQRRSKPNAVWQVLTLPELYLGPHVVVPELAAWSVERLPYLSDEHTDIPPDWVCELISDDPSVNPALEAKLELYLSMDVRHLWIVDLTRRSLRVLDGRSSGWRLIEEAMFADIVRAPPFDAVSFSLADLWPLDKPLGFNEDPQALYAGDR